VLKRIAQVVAVVVVLGALGGLLWVFVSGLLEADADTRTAVIGLVTVVTAAIVTHVRTKKREIEARHFREKGEAYLGFLDLFFDMS